MDPKPVHVQFPSGAQSLGIATAEDVVDVGPDGVHVQLYDIIQIDGTSRMVAGREIQIKSSREMGWPELEGCDVTVRLRHLPVAE